MFVIVCLHSYSIENKLVADRQMKLSIDTLFGHEEY